MSDLTQYLKVGLHSYRGRLALQASFWSLMAADLRHPTQRNPSL